MTPGSCATSTSFRPSRASGREFAAHAPGVGSKPVIRAAVTGKVDGFRSEIAREPSADRAQRGDHCAFDFLSQARARRRLRQHDLARRLSVNQRKTRAVERERVVRCEKVILVVPVLGDPKGSSDALDPRTPGVVQADDLSRFEVKLGAIETNVHGRLLLRCASLMFMILPFIMRFPHALLRFALTAARAYSRTESMLRRSDRIKRSFGMFCMRKRNA